MFFARLFFFCACRRRRQRALRYIFLFHKKDAAAIACAGCLSFCFYLIFYLAARAAHLFYVTFTIAVKVTKRSSRYRCAFCLWQNPSYFLSRARLLPLLHGLVTDSTQWRGVAAEFLFGFDFRSFKGLPTINTL